MKRKAPLQLSDTCRILIVKLSSIGDVVHTLPTLKALRDRFPHAYIAWVVEEKAKDIVLGHPLLDRVFIFEKDRWKKELFKQKRFMHHSREVWSFINELRAQKFDIVIDLQRLLRGAFIALCSGARYRMGFSDSMEGSHLSYNVRIPIENKTIHAVNRYLKAAEMLGAVTNAVEFPLEPSAHEAVYAEEFLRHKGIFPGDILVGLNPGASIIHNRWEKEKFAELGDLLQEKFGVKVVVLGGPQDIELAGDIAAMMRHQPLNLAGKTSIKQLLAFISKCHLFVGNDTGPLHMAVAMKVPTVAIFGPADPLRTGPYGDGNTVVYKKLWCSPCFRHPICGGSYDCMKIIDVGDVFQAAEKQLLKLQKVHA